MPGEANGVDSDICLQAINFGYRPNGLVLNKLDLNVPCGAIYGFLGANGAGKSTTIRVLLGLLKPQSGHIHLFGKELKHSRKEVLGNTGALIEAPSLYLHLTACENLKIACQYHGISYGKIDQILSWVGLQYARDKPCKSFSTGMKQRLGLAIALLHDPRLLVLDEPTNGLDPEGIIEMRDLLLHLNSLGKTIFLSSHLLSEIEKIASHVGIIRDGTLAFEGSVEALVRLRSAQLSIRVHTDDVNKAAEALKSHFRVSIHDVSHLEVLNISKEHIPDLVRLLVDQGINVYEVEQVKSNLENDFVALMGGDSDDT